MTKAQAKKYSLIKWKHFKKMGCTYKKGSKWLEENYPKIYRFAGSCGYCEKYQIFDCCKKCPLYKLWGIDCWDKESLYQKWKKAETIKDRKKYTGLIYNNIKRS